MARTLDETELPRDVSRAVDVDPDELREELARTPADVARAGALAADLHGDWRRKKAARERVLGEVLSDPDFHAEIEKQLGKKPTVDQLKAAALGSTEYLEALEEEIEADVARKKANGYSSALREKAQLLVSLAKLLSREHYGNDDDDEEEKEDDEEEDDEKD